VERNRTKARSADCGFAEPSRRKAAYSYRLLNAVPAYTTLPYYHALFDGFYNSFIKDLIFYVEYFII